MKIGSPADKPPVAPASTGRAAPGDATQKTPAVAGVDTEASAQVELSSAARMLSGVGASTPEFDAEKVARISQAIADGSFKVNAEAIADKLIGNAQELLGKAPH
ncbi:flagellar biosynthesis anti-sigma factor FlgM [Piscinibacter sp. XHJ-5]|uniref:flagellar biosynthesis anti-sigma factor FlgM n=1 Tax=Piscinibacter sp. XHJ-5 TaxID=3037797 RepID=UPI0024532EC4|nr:flagellar biosynthesis anti-sigma factor FlgM [Piscinibacter sp. XHJ-5]